MGAGRETAPYSYADRGRRMADSQAKAEWNKNNTEFIGLKLNKRTDAEILAKLATVPSKQGYIKQLIRADIADK